MDNADGQRFLLSVFHEAEMRVERLIRSEIRGWLRCAARVPNRPKILVITSALAKRRFSQSALLRKIECSLRQRRHLELDFGELVGRFADLAQER